MPELKLKLNPQIKEMDIGIRDLRTITIYPLSFRDQEKLKEVVFSGINQLVEIFSNTTTTLKDEGTDEEVGNILVVELFQRASLFAVEFIQQNIESFVRMAVPDEYEKEGADLLAEMSLNQIIDLAETIYEVNYSFLSQLVQKWTKKFLKKEGTSQPMETITTRLKESLPKSPEDTPTH